MPLHEIRETIQLEGSTTNGILQLQKRIEISPGNRHTIMHLDFFDDNFGGFNTTPSTATQGYQVYVSNYPIILTDNQFTSPVAGMKSGPLAGDDLVLFKANSLSTRTTTTLYGSQRQEFPNQFLGSQPTFSFYTPQLYFTVIFSDATDLEYTRNVAMSLYMAVESYEVEAVEYGMGMIQEYSQNQAIVLRSQGRAITQREIIAAQPLWQIGGIRAEFMSSNDINTLGQQWFYSQAGYGESEGMTATDTIRSGLSSARKMADALLPFGDRANEIPDWFKAIAKPFPGLESGPVRAQFPPLKYNDNGNTLMF